MKILTSGEDADKANGKCYMKGGGEEVSYRLALYENKAIYFAKMGEVVDEGVIETCDLSCGGQYEVSGKSIVLKLDGLRGVKSRLNIVSGEMDDDDEVNEGEDDIIITEAELLLWTFGWWDHNKEVESDSD